MRTNLHSEKGFTLIEVLVSVSIFAMVMLVATGSVFSIVEANKKTHSLKSVMTNLNFALESMMREIRLGSKYGCDTGVGSTGDCQSGGATLYFKANRVIDGSTRTYNQNDLNDYIEYSVSGGRIMKAIFGTNSSSFPITAQEISIQSMKFYVTGSSASDGKQPKVVITVQGYAGTGDTKSSFNIETTVSQRAIDS